MVSSVGKTVAASILMGAVGAAFLHLMRDFPDGTRFDILRLAVVVPASAGVYWLAARFLRIEELGLLTGGKAR